MTTERTTTGTRRRRALRIAVRLAVLLAVVHFLVVPLAHRFERAADRLRDVDVSFLVAGVSMQVVALWCYSVMTSHALGEERDAVTLPRLFAIQLSTRAVTSAVPGGAAAGPALAYRLLTRRGVSGHGATAALTSAGLGSALVLNVVLWLALVASIPLYGFRPVYALAALIGIVLMMLVAAVVAAIVDGSSLLDRPGAFVVRQVERASGRRTDRRGPAHPVRQAAPPDVPHPGSSDVAPLSESIRRFGVRIETILRDRRQRTHILGWAAANWLVDAASLWLFLRALGEPVHPIGVLVAFGVANVLAAIPISPGGVGIVEWAYLTSLVTFGAGLDQVTLAVVAYRLAQWAFPIVLGTLSFALLEVDERTTRRRRLSVPH